MAFLKTPGGNQINEPELVPDGEYDLVCKKIEDLYDEKAQIILDIDILTNVVGNPQGIRHWITWPKDSQTEEGKKFVVLMQRRTCALFKVEFDNGFDPEEFVGKTARCFVGQNSYKNDSGEEQINNNIIPPPLMNEDGLEKTKKRRRAS